MVAIHPMLLILVGCQSGVLRAIARSTGESMAGRMHEEKLKVIVQEGVHTNRLPSPPALESGSEVAVRCSRRGTWFQAVTASLKSGERQTTSATTRGDTYMNIAKLSIHVEYHAPMEQLQPFFFDRLLPFPPPAPISAPVAPNVPSSCDSSASTIFFSAVIAFF